MKNWHYSRKAAADLLALLDAPKPPRIDYNLGPAEVWTLADWCEALKLKLPDFDFTVGEVSNDETSVQIELYEQEDNALLGGAAFSADISQSRSWSMSDTAMDYLAWVNDHRAWGIDPQAA